MSNTPDLRDRMVSHYPQIVEKVYLEGIVALGENYKHSELLSYVQEGVRRSSTPKLADKLRQTVQDQLRHFGIFGDKARKIIQDVTSETAERLPSIELSDLVGGKPLKFQLQELRFSDREVKARYQELSMEPSIPRVGGKGKTR